MTARLQRLTTLIFSSVLVFSNAFLVPNPRRTVTVTSQVSPLFFSKEKEDTPLGPLQRRFESFLSELPFENKQIVASRKADNLSGGRSSILLPLSTALAPAAEFLDEKTDGWALTYADLRPESEFTTTGQAFLATNIAYAVAGFVLSSQGEALLGFMTEIVSVASFCYHYTQLQQPYNRTDDNTVKLALMVDYILASSSILIGLIYLLQDQTLPLDGLASSALGITCLLCCWRWEKGLPYIAWHSLWHLFSAYSAYSIGICHVAS